MSWKENIAKKLMGLYPPFLGAGIQVKHLEESGGYLVSMGLKFYNKNYVGTQFGGSLYSMCDPFYMLILMQKLGREYLVWDKAAAIKFKQPGRGKVSAHFEISQAELDQVIKEVERQGKYEPIFTVDVIDTDGRVVATVEKTLWIKKK
jgi:hypothetical protein